MKKETTPEQASEEKGSELSQAPGVIILCRPGQADGSIHIDIQELAGLDPLAVPTLLRAAAKVKEQSLGV